MITKRSVKSQPQEGGHVGLLSSKNHDKNKTCLTVGTHEQNVGARE